ncbi:MAG: protein-export chaperone SecB [Desulfurivibrionaceae bacterium]
MAEENQSNAQKGQNQQESPVFRLQKLYLKDLSFENPNAPEIFMEKQEPTVDINLEVKHRALEDDHYEVTIAVTGTVKNGKEGKNLFIIEVEHAGVFILKNIPDENVPMALAVDCPTLMFPFTRQIMSQVSVDGGFMPFLMEPVNFMALYQHQQKKENQN